MTKSGPYHLQSQGKVERSHTSLRKKITYDLFTQKQAGVNWSENLQKYAKCLNNEKREKSLDVDQPLRYTLVENPTNCSNVERRLKMIGNLFFIHACIH